LKERSRLKGKGGVLVLQKKEGRNADFCAPGEGQRSSLEKRSLLSKWDETLFRKGEGYSFSPRKGDPLPAILKRGGVLIHQTWDLSRVCEVILSDNPRKERKKDIQLIRYFPFIKL